MSNKDDGARLAANLISSLSISEDQLRLFCDGLGIIQSLYGDITLTDIIEATENLIQNNNKLVDKSKAVT